MEKKQKFRKLLIWQKAMLFISHIYQYSSEYPKQEMFGLTDQIRRAAVGISLNIAEGSGSGSDKEFARFLRMALRSLYEVMAACEIAQMLKYQKVSDSEKLLIEAEELARMIGGLLKKLKAEG
jgi:four helix bundle protein